MSLRVASGVGGPSPCLLVSAGTSFIQPSVQVSGLIHPIVIDNIYYMKTL